MNKHYKKKINFLFHLVVLISFSVVLSILLLQGKDILFKENESSNFVIVAKAKSKNDEVTCKGEGTHITCTNDIITINNYVENIFDERETKLLIKWFSEYVAYGPEIEQLSEVDLLGDSCTEKKEVNCSGVNNFLDAKKSKIILYPGIIAKGLKFVNESLERKITYRDLSYFLAHEYYHHVSQQQFYDLLIPGEERNTLNNRDAVDASFRTLNENEYFFGVGRNREAIKKFLLTNSLTVDDNDKFIYENDTSEISGIISSNCPLIDMSRSRIYYWANNTIANECSLVWNFPSFNSTRENRFYPKNVNFNTPLTLINCGYYATLSLAWNNIKYYFSLDEIITRQMVQLTYIDPSSKLQRDNYLNCNLPSVIKIKKIGSNNEFLFDYYLLNKMGFSVFENIDGYDYANSTPSDKTRQEKVKPVFVDQYFNYFFPNKQALSTFVYNQKNKSYSIGGYLEYDDSEKKFTIPYNNQNVKIEGLVLKDSNGKENFLQMKVRHNLFHVNHFNALDPTTRLINEATEITKLNDRIGYITDSFSPANMEYQLFFKILVGGKSVLIPIKNRTNRSIRVNHGNDKDIRKYGLFYKNEETGYYANFNQV